MAQPTVGTAVRRVDTKHASYKAREDQWRRCRDCYDGTDAVKAKGIDRVYLPMLDSHRQGTEGARAYDAYKTRALFFNALARTVDGLAGAVFQKPPKVVVPDAWAPNLIDVTLRGEPAELVSLITSREVLLIGRYGVLVDITSGTKPRPYWTGYKGVDIVNWRTTRTESDPSVLSLVVLREDDWVVNENDDFITEKRDAYRVLRLTNGVYTSQRWTSKYGAGANVPSGAFGIYEPGPVITPTRRGVPLDFIPFTFFGPTSITVDVQKPPLLDLADVNLSHYRTSADLEHGRHYSGLPTPWLAGAAADGEVRAWW